MNWYNFDTGLDNISTDFELAFSFSSLFPLSDLLEGLTLGESDGDLDVACRTVFDGCCLLSCGADGIDRILDERLRVWLAGLGLDGLSSSPLKKS